MLTALFYKKKVYIWIQKTIISTNSKIQGKPVITTLCYTLQITFMLWVFESSNYKIWSIVNIYFPFPLSYIIQIWHDVHNELKLKMFRWHIKQWHWSSDINKLTGQARETLKSNLLDISTVMQHQFCSTCILLKIRINQSTTMQWNPMIIKQRADKSEIQQVTPRQSMLLMPYSVHIVPSLRVAEIKPRISTREDYRLYTNSLLLASCYKY